MELNDAEKEARLKSEQERLAKKLDAKAPHPVITEEQSEVQRRVQQLGQNTVKVQLVNSHNVKNVMEQEDVVLNKGRIPLQSLVDKWRIKDPVWVDLDLDLSVMPDGYSDCTFAGVKVIRIKATIL